MALGVALGAATGADGALAGDLSPMGGSLSVASGTGAIVHGSGKLTLGLDTLASEYLAFQRALASGTARAGAFATTLTMAEVSGGAVTIDAVAADDPQALKSELESLGAQITGVAAHLVSARLPLERISALEGLQTLRLAFPSRFTTRAGSSVASQGDAAQRSDLARSDSGATGSGITVGVLSDSFDCLGGYAADVASGDLPRDINVIKDDTTMCTDEGRAMAQIVHDVAPGAGIAFNTAVGGQAAFAQGIRNLAAAGAKIIVDDIAYFAEPMFQDGAIAQAVDAVAAAGVAYFSAAGNDARQAYQSAFRGSGQNGPADGELHDFDPGTGTDTRLTIQQNASTYYVLQWSDRYASVSGSPGATTDIDICFYYPVGTAAPLACAASNNAGGDPIEIKSFNGSGTLEISIERYSGPAPTAVKLVAFGDIAFGETYAGTNAGTVFGHANAAHATAVGASAYTLTPTFGTSPPVVNYFSAAGNTPILFDTAGNPVALTRQKPEITAPDGGDNTFFGSDADGNGKPNFFGTSAAAPHAAAVAALMLEVNPSLTPAATSSALATTALDIQTRSGSGFALPGVAVGVGYDNDSGHGLIDARAAVASVEPPPSADLKIAGTATPDPIVSGNSLTYTLTVTNQGPDQAIDVVATDTLPAGVTLVSTNGCNNDRTGVPTCNLGNIATGGAKRYTVAVNVGAAARGSIVNTASVTSDTADPDTANNSATQSTQVNLLGDQDGDNCIGSADVNKVLGAVRAKSGVVATQDINRDGAVNLADARALMQLYTNSNGVCP